MLLLNEHFSDLEIDIVLLENQPVQKNPTTPTLKALATLIKSAHQKFIREIVNHELVYVAVVPIIRAESAKRQMR